MIYKLQPILKHRLWGGNTLPTIFNVNTNDTIGEAWILSCIGNNNSPIGEGKTLKNIFDANKDIVAKGFNGDFPILIKLIDAQKDLSIQVHPEIKTEFWHILNKNPSHLYMGLNKDSSYDEVAKELESGDITKLLNYYEVSYGDSYLIKPGTIHAICKDTFLIEIQQSADVTYRLYDYHRLEADGKERPLHIKESLEVIDYKKFKPLEGNKHDNLITCPYFKVNKLKIAKEQVLEANETSFHSITVLNGKGLIKTNSQEIVLNQYETVFVPANEGIYKLIGDLEVIQVTL